MQQVGMRSAVAAKEHLGDSADRLVAVRELPPVEDIKSWIERLLSYVADSISHIWASVRDFLPQVPGSILAGLKAAARWVIQALADLGEWLRRLFLSLGPLLLGIATWIAIACSVVLCVVIVSSLVIYLLERHEASKGVRLLPGPHSNRRHYGTVDARWQIGVNGGYSNIRTIFYRTGSPAYRPDIASDDVSRPIALVLS